MNVKLDDYEVRVLINGLIQQHRSYDAETNGQIDSLALRLCDIAEAMKPGRKKKIPFEPVETRVIRHCLIDWRNREISQGNDVASEVIGELLQINDCVLGLAPPMLTIPGIGVASAAVILSEFGDLSKFNSPSKLLSMRSLSYCISSTSVAA